MSTGNRAGRQQAQADRGAPAPRRHQQGVGAGEVDSAWASVDAASVVGSATVGGGSGGDLCSDGGRPLSQSRPLSDRGGAGEGAQRLFGIIEELVKWENTTNETVLQKARDEIWQSWRRTCAENVDHPRADELFNRHKLPAFHDPFAGGGSLPLEAQRLGLEAHASDLNPVAVLINKAMIEIPPKFAGQAAGQSRFQLSPRSGGRCHGVAEGGPPASSTRPGAAPRAWPTTCATTDSWDARRGRAAHRPPLPQGAGDRGDGRRPVPTSSRTSAAS